MVAEGGGAGGVPERGVVRERRRWRRIRQMRTEGERESYCNRGSRSRARCNDSAGRSQITCQRHQQSETSGSPAPAAG